jgi:glycosyltransferase involved in cell wall biosynthesis
VGKFDAVLCYLSYLRASFWISYFGARRSGSAFIFGTDASSLSPRNGAAWKVFLKRAFWPKLFSLADQVIVPSTAARDLMLSLGVPPERVTLTPYSVDNEWWIAQSEKLDREAVRANWGATPQTSVILFCAKLQPWERPVDLLRAFPRADVQNALLFFAGKGPLQPQFEAEAAALGVASHVRFLGFITQSQLPAVYASADLMVLPSEYEPFAVVVNEAMCVGAQS